ncbi:DUF1839 family protein [Dactylosporangium sp. NPDC050688]|uniref:DUF1839 family protein n=1 Tax=Dactylosporangium sp. NPDC050688 TaxID=3157217 RepID=UPI0033E4929A
MTVTLLAWRSAPGRHRPHPLHDDPDNDWIDANCYTDLWIELLHGIGADPYPMLAHTVRLDFEGDQWTFFKPPPQDLEALYGIDLFELTTYESLPEHCVTQLRHNRVPVVEVDAFHLPDVPGTFGRSHRKTTIAVVAVDPAAGRLTYLHNSGCHTAGPTETAGLLRTGPHAPDPRILPPYVESVRLDRLRHTTDADLRGRSRALLHRHVTLRPADNPVRRFAATFPAAVTARIGRPEAFEGYAFSTLRQLGAGTALAARYLRWLAADGEPALRQAAEQCDRISAEAKRLTLKAARTVAADRPLHADEALDAMAQAWDAAEGHLRAALPAPPGGAAAAHR